MAPATATRGRMVPTVSWNAPVAARTRAVVTDNASKGPLVMEPAIAIQTIMAHPAEADAPSWDPLRVYAMATEIVSMVWMGTVPVIAA
jgi:hypothetical protein